MFQENFYSMIVGSLGLFLSTLLIVPSPAQTIGPPANQQATGKVDIPALIAISDRNGAAMHQRLVEFTYIQRRIEREAGPRGKMVEQVRDFEAYPIKVANRQRHVLSLIRKDGVPVSAEQLEQSRNFAAQEMEQAERENLSAKDVDREKYITAGIGIGSTGEGVWLGVSQFLQQCRFDAPHFTSWKERETIVLTFHSCVSATATQRENYLTQLTGKIWIDVADKVVVRLEAWPIPLPLNTERSHLNRSPEVILFYEQQLVRNGLWAPRYIRLNAMNKAKLFNGVNKDMIFEFTDYRHFSTDIKEKEIVQPPQKPSP